MSCPYPPGACPNPCQTCCNPCYPCWPCAPCPCPCPEKLAIPYAFPDLPKSRGRRSKKQKKMHKITSTTKINFADISLGKPCRVCKNCTCCCPKLVPPCFVGGCRTCNYHGPPCPPAMPPPNCACTK
ncbi:unnamed protein product [Phyllotreta striolata]|uniref:Uncharacterized protein n=1 Tax=Phyllotreta striolata TaxID=444603 RepID=A0A9N9TIP0_PHYSR|nr:unnamed protein product [Phyllotreta striolata]